MSKFWDKFTLREKLYELGEYSAYKKGIREDLEKELELNEDMLPLFEKLTSGIITNVMELGKLCDEIISENKTKQTSETILIKKRK